MGHFNVLLIDAGHVSFRTTPCWNSIQLPISACAINRTQIQTSKPHPEEFRSGCSCCKRRTISVKTAVLRCLPYRRLNNSQKNQIMNHVKEAEKTTRTEMQKKKNSSRGRGHFVNRRGTQLQSNWVGKHLTQNLGVRKLLGQ